MGILDSIFKKNKKFDIEYILNSNMLKLSERIESEFNTKILEKGIAKKGTGKYASLLPLSFTPPVQALYIGYLFIPIDDSDNVITNDYYQKSRNISDLSDIRDRYHATRFSSILKQDVEVCYFIQNEFGGGNIFNIGSRKFNNSKTLRDTVKDIELIADVRYRCIFYFVSDSLVTL